MGPDDQSLYRGAGGASASGQGSARPDSLESDDRRLRYRKEELLRALAHREALTYEPQPKGLLSARQAVAAYYAERGDSRVSPDDLILTTSTSEGYSFVFRLLCDPGDALLAPAPSYPLFDFLADLQDVKLVPYELVYDHGWQIDFHSLQSAIEQRETVGHTLPGGAGGASQQSHGLVSSSARGGSS